ncbi:MAG: Crp/Fnr family transcriptional regulator [Clostridiales bacterium]|nr:Crp/Fnr family transcriptional regulator [Clostridiales bacterium]
MNDYLQSSLFQKISREEAERMLDCSKAQFREYPAGSLIFGEADRPQYLYLLLEGRVQISKHLPSGKRNLLFQVGELEVFGEVFAAAEDQYYWYEAMAVKSSRILILPYHFIYGVCSNACEHHRMVIRNLLDIQARNNLQMTKKLHIITNTTLKQKIVLWLLDMSRDQKKVVMDMNREELADYLGVTRPSLSRSLMELQKQGIIRIDGKKIWIENMEEIEKIMEDE